MVLPWRRSDLNMATAVTLLKRLNDIGEEHIRCVRWNSSCFFPFSYSCYWHKPSLICWWHSALYFIQTWKRQWSHVCTLQCLYFHIQLDVCKPRGFKFNQDGISSHRQATATFKIYQSFPSTYFWYLSHKSSLCHESWFHRWLSPVLSQSDFCPQ